MTEDFTALCKKLEFFETPQWAAEEILRHELLTGRVIDPCCGNGALTLAARQAGYTVTAVDIHDWGFPGTFTADWLDAGQLDTDQIKDSTVFMNPPFTKACEFVEQAIRLGARKIVCFQRLSWFESESRRKFWTATRRIASMSAAAARHHGDMMSPLTSGPAAHRRRIAGRSGSAASPARGRRSCGFTSPKNNAVC